MAKTHEMALNPAPFSLIKSGTKRVEMRLYDEKRQGVKEGDLVRFRNRESGEELTVSVVAPRRFPDFAALYNAYDKVALGYLENEQASPSDMEEYYTREDIEKYGVLAIEIELCEV